MRKLLFKMFGETKIFGWFAGLAIMLYATVLIWLLYVIVHFANKYW